jgi:hypothetical protein
MRRAVPFLSALVLLAACKRDARLSASEGSVAAEPIASVAASALLSSSAVASAAPAFAARSETRPLEDLVPPAEGDLERPVHRLGKLVVWGEPDESTSTTRVVAKVGDDKPKLLRKTSGKVRAIDAVAMGEDVVVAWASELTAGGAQLIALVTASSDLSRVTAPTTVAMVSGAVQQESHVAVAKNPRGGVIVVHQGPAARCALSGHETDCLTFEVKAVSTDGKVTKLASDKLDGGPSPEYRLLDVDGRALAVLASSMRGGRTLAGVVVPFDPADPKPALTVPLCGGMAAHFPELVRGAAGEIVSVCLDLRVDNPKCVRPLRGDGDRCLRVAAVGLDGKDLAPAVKGRSTAVQRVECGDAGHARLVLDGGVSIELATKVDVVFPFAPQACAR